MKNHHFRNIVLSFVLIYIWILYSFFDYYNTDSMGSLKLFFNFLSSSTCGAVIGVILILLRIIFFRKRNHFQFKNNFIYIMTGLFNLNFSIIWIVSIILKMINIDFEGLYYVFANIIPAIFILIDLYYFKEKTILTSNK